MLRRNFLKSLLGTGAALSLGKAGAAASRRRTVLIQESLLAGFQYHDGERLWSRLREGQALSLVREPANSYDPKAVRIDWRDRKLGYVPRLENSAVSQMLDRGERLTARIVRLKDDPDPWERVRFAINVEVT